MFSPGESMANAAGKRVIFLLTSEAMLRSQVYKFVSIECEGK